MCSILYSIELLPVITGSASFVVTSRTGGNRQRRALWLPLTRSAASCFCCAAPVHKRTVGKHGSPSEPGARLRHWCWSTLRKPPPGWDHDAAAQEVQTVAEATVQTKRVKHEEVLTRLNEYRIGREIGRGAYGTVLKARKAKQAGRASEVAIKVAKRSVLKRIRHGKGTALDSALREIAVMKKLRPRRPTANPDRNPDPTL